MRATKLRRSLIFLCIFSLMFWIASSFGPMILWYAKGGLPAPASKTVSAVEYQAMLDWHKDDIFHGFPSFGAGYFLIAMIALDIIVKTKPTKDDDRDA
jgi:hypothetical protein